MYQRVPIERTKVKKDGGKAMVKDQEHRLEMEKCTWFVHIYVDNTTTIKI